MGHIIKKRTKFQKGNFRPRWDCINGDLATLGMIIPSKVYQHYVLPFWFSKKITVMQKMHWKFEERRSIMNWLA